MPKIRYRKNCKGVRKNGVEDKKYRNRIFWQTNDFDLGMAGHDMKTILQERRKDAEMKFIEMYQTSKTENVSSLEKIKIDIVKIFFEIYDIIENSCHSEIIEKLYFFEGKTLAKLETIANEIFMDISSLRRYRQKYIRVISYVTDPPQGSCLNDFFTDIRL